MSKAEELRSISGNLRESIGQFDRGAAPQVPARPRSGKHAGVTRALDGAAIEISRIIPDPDQPRTEFDPDALERLAASLKTRGQLQPIVVRWDEGREAYVILMGERRWRAAQAAGLPTMRCVVRDDAISDGERLSLQLIENCLREDLSPMEQARAFRTLMDREGWTQERLAEELAVARTVVVKTLSLLKLPEAVQDRVEQGGLSPSHAYELAKLNDPAEQVRLAAVVAEQGLTRDDVAKQIRRPAPTKKKAAAKKLPPAMVWRLDGYRVEVSRKAGVDPTAAAAVLREAADKLEGVGRDAAHEAA